MMAFASLRPGGQRAACGGREARSLLAARCSLVMSVILAVPSLLGQQEPPHDISLVDKVPPDAAMATPLPRSVEKQFRKYDLPELSGAHQALGPQLIDGQLPKPLVDYIVRAGKVVQRVSLFQGGLVVIDVSGAGGTIRKKLIIPADALAVYRNSVSAAKLRAVREGDLAQPADTRGARLRVYDESGKAVERTYDPMAALPKPLADQVLPLQDLLRAMTQDRGVTNTIANYEPAVGDELVSDDNKVWRVARIKGDVVELHCVTDPTMMYISKGSLNNYFIGTR